MKTLQQLFAAILLALALGIPTFAGDMGGPTTAPLPTDSIPAVTSTTSTAVLALNFLMSALSVY